MDTDQLCSLSHTQNMQLIYRNTHAHAVSHACWWYICCTYKRAHFAGAYPHYGLYFNDGSHNGCVSSEKLTGSQLHLPTSFQLLPTHCPVHEYSKWVTTSSSQQKKILPDEVNANLLTRSKINTRLEIIFSFFDSKFVCIILCGARIALVYSLVWCWDVMAVSQTLN